MAQGNKNSPQVENDLEACSCCASQRQPRQTRQTRPEGWGRGETAKQTERVQRGQRGGGLATMRQTERHWLREGGRGLGHIFED